jgi:uncharacterized protein
MAFMGWLLLAGACLGNTALLIFHCNWWYGVPVNRHILTPVRFIHGLMVLVIPVGWWQYFGWDWTGPANLKLDHLLQDGVGGYFLFCFLIGCIVFPLITVFRNLRRAPALLHNHTTTRDVAADLGYRPIGKGKYRWLAHLPMNNIFQVDFSEKTLSLPNLPKALDGLSILQLTDFHFHGTPDMDFYEQVMDACHAWDPDILAITGDIVDTRKHHSWILPLFSRLRWRKAAWAILGNHDSWYRPEETRRLLGQLEIDVLGNRWKQVDIQGEALVVIGNENPWVRPVPDLTDCPKNIFRLCLSHTPDNIRWAQKNRIDLMLAGHNHGGQVRLPVIGSILVPSNYGRRYDGGTYQEDPTVLHVCRGLSAQHPLRFNCRPEVTKLILRTEPRLVIKQ